MLTIVCFGDSVTQGLPHIAEADTFPGVLQRRIDRRLSLGGVGGGVRCINAGVSGENTSEGLARMEADVLVHQPRLVTIEFGLNDLRYEPEKYLPEASFAENLREMYENCAAIGAEVLFMTPNPIINRMHPYSQGIAFYDRWNGCNGAVEVYAQVVREVAYSTGAMLADVYGAFAAGAVAMEFAGETDDWRDLTCLAGYIRPDDGVHPTTAGQQLIALTIYSTLTAAGWFDSLAGE